MNKILNLYTINLKELVELRSFTEGFLKDIIISTEDLYSDIRKSKSDIEKLKRAR